MREQVNKLISDCKTLLSMTPSWPWGYTTVLRRLAHVRLRTKSTDSGLRSGKLENFEAKYRNAMKVHLLAHDKAVAMAGQTLDREGYQEMVKRPQIRSSEELTRS